MPKINFIALLLILTHMKLATAHAVVTEHSLQIAPIQSGRTSRVKLIFNAGIELGLCKFYLVRAGDRHEPVTFSEGTKPGQVIIELPTLEPGEHALRFKIFAADGHLTEDIIRFVVKP